MFNRLNERQRCCWKEMVGREAHAENSVDY